MLELVLFLLFITFVGGFIAGIIFAQHIWEANVK